jgi:sugar-specific transcriptional regulator TrmB
MNIRKDLFELNLNPYQISVYVYLLVDNKASYQEIASATNMSKRKSVDVIQELIDLGLIIAKASRTNKKQHYSNMYIVK